MLKNICKTLKCSTHSLISTTSISTWSLRLDQNLKAPSKQDKSNFTDKRNLLTSIFHNIAYIMYLLLKFLCLKMSINFKYEVHLIIDFGFQEHLMGI